MTQEIVWITFGAIIVGILLTIPFYLGIRAGQVLERGTSVSTKTWQAQQCHFRRYTDAIDIITCESSIPAHDFNTVVLALEQLEKLYVHALSGNGVALIAPYQKVLVGEDTVERGGNTK
jgi:hypothetical protein